MTTTAVAPTPTATPTRANRILNAQDHCDRCGAQAYVAFSVPFKGEARPEFKVEAGQAGEAELLFCRHHNAKHEPKMAAMGAVRTADERHKIETNTKPSS